MGDGELLQAQVERKGLCNQIYHTDCMELLAQIPDNYVSLILTDPPYGISYRNHFSRKPHAVLTGDTGIDYERFARESYRILRENSHAYFFTCVQQSWTTLAGVSPVTVIASEPCS